MNYFAHGHPFVDEPYFLAGTALPDWLGVADRRIRLPPRKVAAWTGADNPSDSQIVQGILRHHADDAQFHVNRAFHQLCFDFRREIHAVGGGLDDHMAGLMAHIIVELLLDSTLIEADPQLLNRYYAAVRTVDPSQVAGVVAAITGRDSSRLVRFIEIFLEEEFLRDYVDDERLCFRLDQIFWRARQQRLPVGFKDLIPAMRRQVATQQSELLPP